MYYELRKRALDPVRANQMLLWIVMAVLAAAASLSVLVPLYRSRRVERQAGAEKLSIYRDQLAEVDRDLARGLVADSEAEAARTEIARRLLRASDDASLGESAPSDTTRKTAVVVAIVAMPLLTLGLYLAVGSPHLPDQPLGARLNASPQDQDIATLIARVEAHLAANPEDGRGWETLGPVYIRLGRNDDAVRAFANALRLLGATAEREANVGEAITRANGNVVTAEARAAFERAQALDEEAIRPRFYLAVALDQEGRKEEAIAAWRDILDGASPDAPWAEVARQALTRLEGAPPAQPGPSAEDVEAAESLSAEERTDMISGMVASLAARLEANPQDAEGWARLIRSYMVLDREAEARGALEKARNAVGSDTEKLAIVENEARRAGLME
jgi:cytochrome c-type biogenesis protein CcmH